MAATILMNRFEMLFRRWPLIFGFLMFREVERPCEDLSDGGELSFYWYLSFVG